jgi:hypothetical protein
MRAAKMRHIAPKTPILREGDVSRTSTELNAKGSNNILTGGLRIRPAKEKRDRAGHPARPRSGDA